MKTIQDSINVTYMHSGNPEHTNTHTHTTVLWPFFRDHPGESVPEENFWTLWCKGRLTEADALAIWLATTPSGLSTAHLYHPLPHFLQAVCHSCCPTNSVKALKAIPKFLVTYFVQQWADALSHCCASRARVVAISTQNDDGLATRSRQCLDRIDDL